VLEEAEKWNHHFRHLLHLFHPPRQKAYEQILSNKEDATTGKEIEGRPFGKDGEYLTVGSNGINSYDHVLFGRIKQTRYGGTKKQDREEWKLCDSRDQYPN
jgi:hypothetical protein